MQPLRDLPVSVELDGELAEAVTAYVETEAGWQVVAGGGPPRPVVTLTARPRAGEPCVVVVEGAPDHEVTRAALLAGALDVIGWPADRARLLEAPLRVRALARPVGAAAVLRVGGAAGGTGTSTVALALAGLLAWRGARTLVAGGDDLLALCGLAPWGGPGAADVAVIDPSDARREVDALARAVPGVAGLVALGGGGAAIIEPEGWPADVVVIDVRAGGRADADVLVARPDVGVRAVAGASAPVVLVGDGPLDARGVARILGRRPAAWLPASARVARAGLAGRVPSALPGRWLASLETLLARLHR